MQHMQKPIAYYTATVKQWSSSRCFLFCLWNAPRLIFRRRKVILRIDFSNIMILSHGCRLLCRWLNSFQLIPSGSYWVLWAKSSSFKAAHLSTNTCMWPVKVSENWHIDKANYWMSSVHTMSHTYRTFNWIFWPAFAHNDSSILNADHLVRVLEIFWKSSDCTHPRLFETVDLLHRTCLWERWFLGHQPCPQCKQCAYHHLCNSVRTVCGHSPLVYLWICWLKPMLFNNSVQILLGDSIILGAQRILKVTTPEESPITTWCESWRNEHIANLTTSQA